MTYFFLHFNKLISTFLFLQEGGLKKLLINYHFTANGIFIDDQTIKINSI